MNIKRWLYDKFECELADASRKRQKAAVLTFATGVLGWMIFKEEAHIRQEQEKIAAREAQQREAERAEEERRQAEVERWKNAFRCNDCGGEFLELHLNGQCYDCWKHYYEQECD